MIMNYQYYLKTKESNNKNTKDEEQRSKSTLKTERNKILHNIRERQILKTK